ASLQQADIPGRLVSAAGEATRRPPARMTRITSPCCHDAGYRGSLPAENRGQLSTMMSSCPEGQAGTRRTTGATAPRPGSGPGAGVPGGWPDGMDYRTVGHSGTAVSSLCLGTMTFGVETDEPVAHQQLDRFIQAGGNLVDTADVYGDGRSEEI